MPTTLTEAAVERSTYAIAVSFYDEAGKAVEPNAGLTWTLSTSSGVIVNSREKVAIESAETVTIVLHGEDLPARTDRPRAFARYRSNGRPDVPSGCCGRS